MHNGISVVIPNYNGLKLFPETLPTVFAALKKTALPWEILVADDCSTDGSIHFLQTEFPEIKIIAAEKNSGFPVTANTGIRASQFDRVLLLNNDVKLEADYFLSQLDYFQNDDTFGVMGKIIGWDNDTIQDGAKYPSFHGVKIKTAGNYLLENEEEMKNGLYTMYLSGANALISKRIFLEIGGFDEIFSPFYVEDYELSLRAWRLGYKCYYQHGAVCRHKTSATIKSKSRKYEIEKIYNRNKMYLHGIHLPAAERYVYYVQLFFEMLARIITGRFAFVQSVFLFIRNYKQVRNSRNRFYGKGVNRKMLSVKSVADKILVSLKNKKVIRF